MPNKKVELILMFTTKKIFLRVTYFFPKNSIESIKTGKITQAVNHGKKEAVKDIKKLMHAYQPKFHLKKIKLHKICFNK